MNAILLRTVVWSFIVNLKSVLCGFRSSKELQSNLPGDLQGDAVGPVLVKGSVIYSLMG